MAITISYIHTEWAKKTNSKFYIFCSLQKLFLISAQKGPEKHSQALLALYLTLGIFL